MKTLIAVPTLDSMFSLTAQCIANIRLVGDCETKFAIGYPVDTARNLLAEYALKNDFERILWIDSDMTFAPDIMERLSKDLDDGWDIVSGLYFKRTYPTEPVIYKTVTDEPSAEPYIDYPLDSVFPVAGCGFGGVMMKTEILADLKEPPFKMFDGISEDLSFCLRMKGKKMACDSKVKLGHIGRLVYTEYLYEHQEGNNV